MELDSIILVIIGIITPIIIAYLFKYPLQPNIEKIFEKNRNESLAGLFLLIYEHDSKFEYFYEFFEKRFFILNDNISNFKLTKQEITELEQAYQNYKNPVIDIFKKFEELKNLSSFVGLDVIKLFKYYLEVSYFYCDELSMQFNDTHYLNERKQAAMNLVTIIKKENSPKNEFEFLINEFISKWENRLPDRI